MEEVKPKVYSTELLEEIMKKTQLSIGARGTVNEDDSINILCYDVIRNAYPPKFKNLSETESKYYDSLFNNFKLKVNNELENK